MAAHILKQAPLKLVLKDQLLRSFILHRDLKSCLSLREAQTIVKQRQQQIKTYGKTAFLQFLNSFPVNYSYKLMSSPIKIYYFALELEGLNIYEEQLRYTTLLKLKEYVTNNQKFKLEPVIQAQQNKLIEQIRKQPYDTVHALNFLFLQKDLKNNELFLHCLSVLHHSSPTLLKKVFPRVAPLLLKRLSTNEWNILRRFKHFLDYLAYDYRPEQNFGNLSTLILQKLASLQLHLIGYQQIPPAIDYTLGQAYKAAQKSDTFDLSLLHKILQVFNLLPLSFNEKVFSFFYDKLLQRANRQSIYFNELPYKRMSQQQITQLFEQGSRNNFYANLIYYANHLETRRQIMKSPPCLKVVLNQFMETDILTPKQLSNDLIAASLLLEVYPQKRQQLATKLQQKIADHSAKYDLPAQIKTIAIANNFHLIHLNTELNLKLTIIRKLESYLIGRSNKFFEDKPFLEMLLEAIRLYSDSHNTSIKHLICDIILNLIKRNSRFHFKYYSEYLCYLTKSNNSEFYKPVIQAIYNALPKEDCPYFVELYNRFQHKTMKLNISFLKAVWEKSPSFHSIGKMIAFCSFGHFTSPRGEIILEMKNILEALEPLLAVEQISEFFVSEMTSILRFCLHFYSNTSTFSRKFLLLSLIHADKMDISKDSPKLALSFLQQATKLHLQAKTSTEVSSKILSLLNRLTEVDQNSLAVKTSSIQIRWLLSAMDSDDNKSLIVEQILQALANQNYSLKKADVMLGLLKLHAFDIISLSKVVQQKLGNLVLSAIESNTLKTTDLINHAALPYTKGGLAVNPQTIKIMTTILKAGLQKITVKHNFEVYYYFVEFGHLCKDAQLVRKALRRICKIKFNSPQLRKLLHILRYYGNLQIPELYHCIAEQTYNYIAMMKNELPEILYALHSVNNQIPATQINLYEQLFTTSKQFLLGWVSEVKLYANKNGSNETNQQNKLATSILKFLWVAIKTNNIDQKTCRLFAYILQKQNELKLKSEKKQNLALSYESIYLVHLVFLNHCQQHNTKIKQAFLSLASKNKGKPNNYSRPSASQSQYSLQNHLNFLKQQLKNSPRPSIDPSQLQQLQQLNLQQRNNSGSGFMVKSADNCFILEKEINGVTASCWVKRSGKESAFIVLSRSDYNEADRPRGRISFIQNAYKMITGITTVTVEPGSQLDVK